MYVPKKNILINNFLGGLAWGLGSVIGATLVVAMLIWLLSFVNFVPILGSIASQIIQAVNEQPISK